MFSFHEWLFTLKKSELEKHCKTQFSSKGKFWDRVEADEPKAAFVRDIANASKHVTLDNRRSINMLHVANAVIQTSTYNSGDYGTGRYSAPSVMMQDKSDNVSFDDCATALKDYWEKLVKALYP